MPDDKRGGRPASTRGLSKPRRADAVANRARLLAAATDVFEEVGLDAPLDEIARRAGLGAGTLHRHFPTKAALIDATVAEHVHGLAAEAEHQLLADDATTALVDLLTTVIVRGSAAHALADRLRHESGDLDGAVAGPLSDLRAALASLLGRAQRSGGIRGDVDARDLDALLAAAHTLHTHPAGGERLVRLLWDAIRT